MTNHTPPRLYLIDGYALIYRAFFAMISRPLRTSKGENTSAAWGVVNFLMRLREKYKPDYVAWINDAGTSFRAERYPEYKSTREKLDGELRSDFDRALERITALLDAFHIPLVTVPGYEADDVIGTLATRAAERGLQAVIVSGDKDFYQLIGPSVALLNPGRGGAAGVEESWVDESNASERLGVPPSQVIDFLSLVGDASDNIPGVKGIGDKGAQKLLAEYGNLDTLLERAADITAKRPREALLAQADNARLSRELVTIKLDVPVELDVSHLTLKEPDREAAIRILTELEFYQLARRLGGLESEPVGSKPAARGAFRTQAGAGEEGDQSGESDSVAVIPEGQAGTEASGFAASDWLAIDERPALEVKVVDDPAELPALVRQLREAPLVAIDTVATSPGSRAAELVGLSLSVTPAEVWYLPFGHRSRSGMGSLGEGMAPPDRERNLPSLASAEMAPLRELLADPTVLKAGHVIKYDWQVLRRAGVELAGVAYDTMLESFILDPGRRSHAIDNLCLEHLGRPIKTYQDITGKGKTEIPFAEATVIAAAEYCGSDSATVLALHERFLPTIREMQMETLYQEVELPLVEVLVDMEWEGIGVDRAVFERLDGELSADMRRLEGEISRVAGLELNFNSPKQLATVLFEKQQLPVLKKTKTGPSTDADVLEQLAAMGHELPRLILEYRELQKLKSTYVDTLPATIDPRTGRIHTTFNQAGAATGRLSSSDPNLQNIPVRSLRGEEIRRGFIPREGWTFLVADYSQIELRIMAHLSGDPAFIEAFNQGGDIHRQTAALIFNVEAGPGDARDAGARQDHQLRHHLRAGPLRAEPPAQHLERGRAQLHRPLLRALRRRPRVSRSADRAGPRAGLRRDHLQAPALHPRDPRPQLQHAGLRGAERAELSIAGLRGGSDQGGDAAHPRRDPRRGAPIEDAAPGARRAGVRRAARGAAAHARAGEDPHGGRGGAAGAARRGLG